MASSYDISGGDSTIEILSSNDSFASIQIISTSTLNADISVNLKHSSNDANYEDLANTTQTIAAGESSILIETTEYTLDKLYLDIDVGSATVGTIEWYISSKKKDSDEVNATIEGSVNVSGNEDIILNQELLLSYNRELSEIKELIKITNTHLSLITGDDIK